MQQETNKTGLTQELIIKSRNKLALIESAVDLMLHKGEIDETLLQAIKDTSNEAKEDLSDLALEFVD